MLSAGTGPRSVPHYAMSGGTLRWPPVRSSWTRKYWARWTRGRRVPRLHPPGGAPEARRGHPRRDLIWPTPPPGHRPGPAYRQAAGDAAPSEEEADRLADLLSSGTWTHDYPISVSELRAFGLMSLGCAPEIYALMSLFPQTSQRRIGGVRAWPVRRPAGSDRPKLLDSPASEMPPCTP